jgi:hypothetical protein
LAVVASRLYSGRKQLIVFGVEWAGLNSGEIVNPKQNKFKRDVDSPD